MTSMRRMTERGRLPAGLPLRVLAEWRFPSRSDLRWLAALVAACALSLSACSTPTARQDESSPYYAVPQGSVLQLHRPIEIRPGSTRTWIQRGEVVRGFDRYWPNCSLEVSRLDHDNSQIVEPGGFTVTRSQFLREEVAILSHSVRVAALRLAAAEDSGGHSMIYEGWHLWLDHPDRPNVRRLTCRGVFADPADARPPSIDEIRAALGEVATLRLP